MPTPAALAMPPSEAFLPTRLNSSCAAASSFSRFRRAWARTGCGHKGVTAAQLALAWVHAGSERLGAPVVPIPGTKRVKWLEQNVAAESIELTADEVRALDALAAQVVGGRY